MSLFEMIKGQMVMGKLLWYRVKPVPTASNPFSLNFYSKVVLCGPPFGSHLEYV